MKLTKQAKARAVEMQRRGASLREIAVVLGCSHELVRTLLAGAPPPVPVPARGARVRRPSAKRRGAAPSLIETCTKMAEVLRRRQVGALPIVAARYAQDSAALGALLLRIRAREAQRAEGLAITREGIQRAIESATAKINKHLAST